MTASPSLSANLTQKGTEPSAQCRISKPYTNISWDPKTNIRLGRNIENNFICSNSIALLAGHFTREVYLNPYYPYDPSDPTLAPEHKFENLAAVMSMAPWSNADLELFKEKFGATDELLISYFLKNYENKTDLTQMFSNSPPSAAKNTSFGIYKDFNYTYARDVGLQFCQVSDVELFKKCLACNPNIHWKVGEIARLKSFRTDNFTLSQYHTRVDLIYELSVDLDQLGPSFNRASLKDDSIKSLQLTIIETPPTSIKHDEFILCSSVLSSNQELNFYHTLDGTSVTACRNLTQSTPAESFSKLLFYAHVLGFFNRGGIVTPKAEFFEANFPRAILLKALVEHFCFQIVDNPDYYFLRLVKIMIDPDKPNPMINIVMTNEYAKTKRFCDEHQLNGGSCPLSFQVYDVLEVMKDICKFTITNASPLPTPTITLKAVAGPQSFTEDSFKLMNPLKIPGPDIETYLGRQHKTRAVEVVQALNNQALNNQALNSGNILGMSSFVAYTVIFVVSVSVTIIVVVFVAAWVLRPNTRRRKRNTRKDTKDAAKISHRSSLCQTDPNFVQEDSHLSPPTEA